MNCLYKYFLKSGLVLLLGGMTLATELAFSVQANPSQNLGKGYDYQGNGKRTLPCFDAVYLKQNLSAEKFRLEYSQPDLERALARQLGPLKTSVLKGPGAQSLKLQRSHLSAATKFVLSLSQPLNAQSLMQKFETHLIRGEDGCGNTHLTAYYSPILKVKAKPDAEYRYPLYQMPKKWPQNKPLTRAEIDQNKGLQGQGLELAYSDSLLANFFLQVQGSGVAKYLDTGELVILQYAGQNGHPYTSLGRQLVENGHVSADKISLKAIQEFFEKHPEKLETYLYRNASYVFFRKARQGPLGSLNTEVVPKVSIAVDPQFIPLGSILLAEVPQLDAQGQFSGYQWRLVVAQDTGGAIRGSGHVDVYMGTGPQAEAMASQLHHYGRLWLLLPKGK